MSDDMRMSGFLWRDHRSCLILSQLSLDLVAEDRKRVGKRRSVLKGEQLWRPSDTPDRMYVLERGRMNVITTDDGGRELLLQVVTAGETFGELCFCAEDGGIRNSTAMATAAAEVTEIRFQALLEHLQTRVDLLQVLITAFCARLNDCEVRTVALSYRDAEQRIGRLLLWLAKRPHQPAKNVAHLAVTHRELALLASMTRSHVTVVLNRFRNRKAIAYQRMRPITVRIDRLEALLVEEAEPEN